MNVVTGAIERVDHPTQRRHLPFRLPFFADKAVLGEPAQQDLTNRSLSRNIGLGD